MTPRTKFAAVKKLSATALFAAGVGTGAAGLGWVTAAPTARAAQADMQAQTAQTRPAPDADQIALAKQLLDQTDVAAVSKEAMERQIQSMQQAGANVPPGFFDAFRDEINMEQLTDELAQVYAKNLTKEEMQSAIDFFKTPLGKSYVKKQPAILRESAQAGERLGKMWGMKAAQKVQQGGGQ